MTKKEKEKKINNNQSVYQLCDSQHRLPTPPTNTADQQPQSIAQHSPAPCRSGLGTTTYPTCLATLDPSSGTSTAPSASKKCAGAGDAGGVSGPCSEAPLPSLGALASPSVRAVREVLSLQSWLYRLLQLLSQSLMYVGGLGG